MGLETVVNISDLVKANPTASDPKSQGDDQIRNVKTAMVNGFAGFPGAVKVTGTDGGAANAYTLTPASAMPAYGAKMTAVFAPTVANTGASTLNISGLGAKALKSVSGADLASGDLVPGSIYAAYYTGAEFRLLAVTKNYIDQLAFSAVLPAQLGNDGKYLCTDGTSANWKAPLPDQAGMAGKVLRTDGTITAWGEVGTAGAPIASAANLNLDTATGDFVHVTGTTAITAITIPVGAVRTVVFDAVLVLTHSAALLLPGAANIATAAGDRMMVRGDAAGAIVVSYTRADGKPLLSGGLTLLATLTPTAVATLDLSNIFTPMYDNYLVLVDGVESASNDTFRVRLANGGTPDNGLNYYQISGAAITETTSASSYITLATSLPTAGTRGLTATIEIKNVNDATRLKSIHAHTVFQSATTPGYTSYYADGAYTSGAVSGFTLFWGSGVTLFEPAGRVRVYGYSNT